jgi:sigma-B regulation protein RsbU (phosphoserine phosphatase)
MPKLILQSPPRDGEELSFDKSIVVGRASTADLRLDHPHVSRRHALLRCTEDECFILDLNSGNGTVVNGRRITTPTRLRDGDILGFGPFTAAYHESPTVAAAPAAEPESVRWSDKSLVQTQARVAVVAAGGAREAAAPDILLARLKFIEALGKISSQAFELPALLTFVLDELLALMPQAQRGLVLLRDKTSGDLAPEAVRTRGASHKAMQVSRTILEDVIRTREGILASDMAADERYSKAESVLALEMNSVIAMPMILDNEVYGVIQLDTPARKPFTKADLSLVAGIATIVVMALGYARLHATLVERELFERDLELAQNIQRHFMPRVLPALPGYAFAVDWRPAIGVGGDFYTVLDLADGVVGIAVGDVAGKGLSAALYGAKVLSDLRYLSAGQTDPAAILERVNHSLFATEAEGMFLTMVLAVLHAGKAQIVVASAGHPLPFVRDASGRVVAVGRTGDAPLGVAPDAHYEQYRYELDSSDVLVLYTDGITEALSPDKELFGEGRLIEAIQQPARGSRGVLGSVQSQVQRFVGGAPQSDDITLLCIGREQG